VLGNKNSSKRRSSIKSNNSKRSSSSLRKPTLRNEEVQSCSSVERRKNKSQGLFINNYKIKKHLGEGGFGKVKLCEDV